MKVGDLVRVVKTHKSAGDLGVIVDCSDNTVNVYWNVSDATYWIEKKFLEILHESSDI